MTFSFKLVEDPPPLQKKQQQTKKKKTDRRQLITNVHAQNLLYRILLPKNLLTLQHPEITLTKCLCICM